MMIHRQEFALQTATTDDVESITHLAVRSDTKFLGQSKRAIVEDPVAFMESYATHRILARLTPDDEHLVGYAEFVNYPRIAGMDATPWTVWMNKHFSLGDLFIRNQNSITISNTLFLGYFLYDPVYYPDLLHNLFREVFFRERKLRFILTIERPYFPRRAVEDEPTYDHLEQFGKLYYPKIFDFSNCQNTQKLYVSHRNDIIVKMRYRKALPEDNDDIVGVIDREHPEIKETYGDYYIAEELLANDPHKTLVITEINLITVGFFWINDDVNIMKLIRNFELEQYGNLLKVSMGDEARTSVVNVTAMERRQPAKIFTSEAIAELLNGTVTAPLYIDQDDWSSTSVSYNSLPSYTARESRVNYATFGSTKACFQQMHDLTDNFKSSSYYFKQTAKLIRVLYTANSPKQSNAFAVQFVGLHTWRDVRELFRFLMAAFSHCSDRDYCLFSMPVRSKVTPTIHQLLKYFFPVVARPGREIDDTLYITHRSCLFGDLILQNLTKADTESIKCMLSGTDMKPPTTDAWVQTENDEESTVPKYDAETEMVLKIMNDLLNNKTAKYIFITIRVGNSDKGLEGSVVIGFVILRQFDNLHLLGHHFHMPVKTESLHQTHGEVVVLRLHPLFRFESDFVFREIARISGFRDFYHIRPTKYHKNFEKPFTNDLINKMQPIEPKRIKTQKFIQRDNLRRNTTENIAQFSYADDRFAAYVHRLLPSKFFSSTKATVIVGFNALCKAYLRLKIFEWNTLDFRNQQRYCCLPWYNITVITKPGVAEAELDLHFKCATCAEQEMCWVNWSSYDSFVRDATLRMDLTKYAKFVNGKISRIDRANKTVVMENDCVIYYDELILMAETEHGLPYNKSVASKWPANYQHINHRLDKILMYYKLQVLIGKDCEDEDVKIVVYGNHVTSFEFINFLIKHGIKGKNIILVLYIGLPIDIELMPNNPTHDLAIELILQQMVDDLGVEVHNNYVFSHWNLADDDSNTIKSVVFNSPYRPKLTLDCHMFISYYETTLDFRYIKVLNEAGIELKDDKIVIDYAFRTNDPYIFAAGKSTIPNEIPRAQYLYVDSREQAAKLVIATSGKTINLSNFDVRYHESSYFAAQLPFDYFMVKIIMPKKHMTHMPNENSYGLTTYHDHEFCRVRLNEQDIVEEIVCITKKRVSMDFLKFFCGKHQLLLNNLKSRHYLRDFNSFFEFFQQPWAELIQHEFFYELQEQNKALIIPIAQQILTFQKGLDRKVRQQLLHKTLLDSGTKTDVEANLLRFLRKYRDDFHTPFALPEDFLQSMHF